MFSYVLVCSSVAHDSRKLAQRSEQFDDIYGV